MDGMMMTYLICSYFSGISHQLYMLGKIFIFGDSNFCVGTARAQCGTIRRCHDRLDHRIGCDDIDRCFDKQPQ